MRRALLLLVLPACHAVYAPNMPSVPLFQHAGELRASVDPRNLQLAYAPVDHVGVLANGYYRSETDEHDEAPDEKGRGHLLELGVGMFADLPSLHPWLIAEAYAGFGAGAVEFDQPATNSEPARHFEASGVRAFVQPSIGVSRKYFDVALSARLVAVKYDDVEQHDYGDVFAGVDARTWWFAEPCLTLRAGYRWVKAQLQYGKSWKLNEAELDHDEGLLTLGIHIAVTL